jgi:hypothetical protein
MKHSLGLIYILLYCASGSKTIGFDVGDIRSSLFQFIVEDSILLCKNKKKL